MAGKWIDPETGQEVTEIAKLNGKGVTTRISVKRALGMGLIRSVTSKISDVLGDSYGLVDWKLNQSILAASEHPKEDNEAPDDYAARIKAIAREYTLALADRGSDLHGMLNRFIDNGIIPDDPAGTPLCEEFGRFLEFAEIEEASSEKVLMTAEDCGTPDFFTEHANLRKVCEWCNEAPPPWLSDDKGPLIIDFKTKDALGLKPKAIYMPVYLQLGAYDTLLGFDVDSLSMVWQADRETGVSATKLLCDLRVWRDAWLYVNQLWAVRASTGVR